jgi:hypothetical protein
LDIKYSTGKTIMRTFKHTGRIDKASNDEFIFKEFEKQTVISRKSSESSESGKRRKEELREDK